MLTYALAKCLVFLASCCCVVKVLLGEFEVQNMVLKCMRYWIERGKTLHVHVEFNFLTTSFFTNSPGLPICQNKQMPKGPLCLGAP